MPDPPHDIFSTCGECIINLSGEIRVSVAFMSVGGNLDFVLMFHFMCQVCILLTRLSKCAKNLFNLQLCASILGALCASILYHYALAGLVSDLKCSMMCSQAAGASFGFLVA